MTTERSIKPRLIQALLGNRGLTIPLDRDSHSGRKTIYCPIKAESKDGGIMVGTIVISTLLGLTLGAVLAFATSSAILDIGSALNGSPGMMSGRAIVQP
jgi:hypothetical protein